MMLLLIAALQAGSPSALSRALPREEQLRFVFVREGRPTRARISGTAGVPTTWSGPSFFRIVRHCGGERIGVEQSNGREVVVTSASGGRNLAVARCIKASTSVRFWAGIRQQGGGAPVFYDQRPFAALWDRDMASADRAS